MRKYSNDYNARLLVALMKEHGIKRIIASPGTTNLAIVGSMQHDSFFTIYSCVDERSAAYMACGMAAESGETVAIVCTGATASRNYLPALTEAFYRKLPILAICGSHGESMIGHLHSQVIDRTQPPKDTLVYKTFINPAISDDLKWYNNVEINKALIRLRQHGGGPVMINIVANAYKPFGFDKLPSPRVIQLISKEDDFPILPEGRIALFVGSHKQMSQELQNTIDSFCESHNAVVFCDNTSGYQGRYRFVSTLVHGQYGLFRKFDNPTLLIHLGEISGDTYTTKQLKPKKVWRVSPDGEIRDLFKKLEYTFEIEEIDFFQHYISNAKGDDSYLKECQGTYDEIFKKMPEVGFSNIYVASQLVPRLPRNSVIHFGIFNSLRTWNFFLLDSSIHSSCNVGGFGIDGACSTLIGAALVNPEKIYYLCVGDLAFFYDLNVLGNRHVPSNIRIILIDNGRGVEFRKKDHPGSKFGNEADLYIAAGGHNGNQSVKVVKNFVSSLGFEYLSATSKKEFLEVSDRFVNPKNDNRPMLLEVFVNQKDDVVDLEKLRNILKDERPIVERLKGIAKDEIKKILE